MPFTKFPLVQLFQTYGQLCKKKNYIEAAKREVIEKLCVKTGSVTTASM